MHNYDYTIEDSNLYLNFPISFNSENFIIEMLDAGNACATYGSARISNSTIQVYNVGFRFTDGSVESINNAHYAGYVLALGF